MFTLAVPRCLKFPVGRWAIASARDVCQHGLVLWWSAFTALTGAVSSFYVLLLITRFCFGMGEAGAYPNIGVAIARWFPLSTPNAGLGHRADVRPAGRRHRALRRRTDAGAVRLAGVVPSVRPVWCRVGDRVWFWWFRDSPAEKPGVTSVELLELGGEPPVGHGGMPWGQALRSGTLWRITAIGACYVYAIAFFQSWLQTYLVKGHGFSEAALVLSSLPYVVGGCANGIGGVASDWLVRRFGLKTGRRALGVVGLSVAAIFMAATIATTSGGWALIFLSLAYAGILAQQPNLCAVCLDTGRGHAGAVFGFMNTAANAASAVSSIVFGYLVAYFGNYNAPFVPMVATLCLGAWLWLRMDPTHQLFDEQTVLAGTPVEVAV